MSEICKASCEETFVYTLQVWQNPTNSIDNILNKPSVQWDSVMSVQVLRKAWVTPETVEVMAGPLLMKKGTDHLKIITLKWL